MRLEKVSREEIRNPPMKERFLDGKVAFVTGGGRGLGAVTAKMLARAGVSVVVVARSEGEIESVARDIEESGGQALALRADVRETQQVQAAVDKTIDTFSRIDILINMAGVVQPMGMPTWEADPMAWRECIDSNLFGFFLTCHAVLPHMIDQGFGCVLNMSSPAAYRPIERASAYCAARAGINHFTEVLALELEDTDVTANSFNIGPTNVPTLHEVYDTLYPELPKNLVERTMQDPEQAVWLILWMCSPHAAHLSGQFLEWKDRRVWHQVNMFRKRFK